MTDLRKAAEMAIDAMIDGDSHKRAEAIIELRQALAQPEDEWSRNKGEILAAILRKGLTVLRTSSGYELVTLGQVTAQTLSQPEYQTVSAPQPRTFTGQNPYTAPPKREWVGLTDDEIYYFVRNTESYLECAKGIEAKLKEKNT